MIAEGLDVNARGREGMESGADIERPPAGEYTGKIEQLFLKPVMEMAAGLNAPADLASLLRHGGDPNALEVYGAQDDHPRGDNASADR